MLHMHASACTHPCVSWASYSLFSFGKWTHQNVISKVLECVVNLVQTCQAPGLTRRWLWTFVFSPGAPHGHCSFFPLTIFLLFFASTHLYLITLVHPILKSHVILVILMMITNKAMCCAVITCWLQGLEKQLIWTFALDMHGVDLKSWRGLCFGSASFIVRSRCAFSICQLIDYVDPGFSQV